jgi:hypothetical protein
VSAVRRPPIPEQVRRHCAAVAARARWVRIDSGATTPAGGTARLDPEEHFLEGRPEDVARYVLILDAVNFGSGWFPTLRGGDAWTATARISRRLTDEVRRRGAPWTPTEMRALDAGTVARVLDEEAGHPLMALYAQALNQLGRFLGNRGALDVVDAAGGSAARLAAALAAGMPFFDDPGFFKRAQITANDLVLAGVARFADVDHLTVFADNLVPHVLRLDGVLVYEEQLAARVARALPLPPGGEMEREVRACAVHACEGLARRLGVPPRVLDNWLWNRGQRTHHRARPHLTRTVFY